MLQTLSKLINISYTLFLYIYKYIYKFINISNYYTYKYTYKIQIIKKIIIKKNKHNIYIWKIKNKHQYQYKN